MKALLQEFLESKLGTSYQDQYAFYDMDEVTDIRVDHFAKDGHLCFIEYTYIEEGEELKPKKEQSWTARTNQDER